MQTFKEQQAHITAASLARERANRITTLRAARRHCTDVSELINTINAPALEAVLVRTDVVEFIEARIRKCDSTIAYLLEQGAL